MTAPGGLTARVRADWDALARAPAAAEPVDPDVVAALPEPARRWLRHAVDAGTPPRTAVELRMHGEIRLGAWRPFTAVQRLAPDGFVWAATARLRGLPVTGFDRLTRGSGEMRWRLLGAVPVMAARGPDVTRSAEGRHAGELLLGAPAAALDPRVTWTACDAERVTAHLDGHDVTLTVGPRGGLTELAMRRWGNPDGEYAWCPFGAVLEGELAFDGMRIPRTIAAGWHHGTDRWDEGRFIRYTIDAARCV